MLEVKSRSGATKQLREPNLENPLQLQTASFQTNKENSKDYNRLLREANHFLKEKGNLSELINKTIPGCHGSMRDPIETGLLNVIG